MGKDIGEYEEEKNNYKFYDMKLEDLGLVVITYTLSDKPNYVAFLKEFRGVVVQTESLEDIPNKLGMAIENMMKMSIKEGKYETLTIPKEFNYDEEEQ